MDLIHVCHSEHRTAKPSYHLWGDVVKSNTAAAASRTYTCLELRA